MQAKLARPRQLAFFVIAMLTASCAFEATNDEGENTTRSSETAPVVRSDKPGGSNPCGPVLRPDQNGVLFVEAYLCPMPQKPERDPEAIQPLQDPTDPWVTVDTGSLAKPD